jgi:hypothetical protein
MPLLWGGLATHIPDINSCEFFLWGIMKDKLYFRKTSGSLVELRAMIIWLCHTVSEHLCLKVIINIQVHLEEVMRQNGSHVEHLCATKQLSMLISFSMYVIYNILLNTEFMQVLKG